MAFRLRDWNVSENGGMGWWVNSSRIEGQDSSHGRQLPLAGKYLTRCLHGLDTEVSDKTERHRKAGFTNSGGHHAICQTGILLNYLVFA